MFSDSHKSCPVCAGTNFKKSKEYFVKKDLLKCLSCGFVFMNKIPTNDELNNYYKSYSYGGNAYLSPITVKSYNKLLDEFEKFRMNNKILDVGCGRGWFLEVAKLRGWNVYGTEYSETAVELCRNKGIEMIQGELSCDSFADADFDVITSFEVIEHLSFPGYHVEVINKLLRIGGLFYCTTPNFDALQRYTKKSDYDTIAYPEHLSYFNKSSLCKLVKNAGFKNIKFKSTGLSVAMMNKKNDTLNLSMNSSEHPDEKFREVIDKKWYMQILKNFANLVLTAANKGFTLKGYFVKIN